MDSSGTAEDHESELGGRKDENMGVALHRPLPGLLTRRYPLKTPTSQQHLLVDYVFSHGTFWGTHNPVSTSQQKEGNISA